MSLLVNRYSVMTFYSDPTDPACHAVRFVLAEKDINVDVVQVQGDHRPEELNDLNPYGAVLTLVDRDLVLYEEHIIMEYLDERFPHPPLMPVYPVARGNCRLMMHRVELDWYTLADKILNNAPDAEAARKQLRESLQAMAPLFQEYPYFMNEEFSQVDCYMAPLMWRLPIMGIEFTGKGAKELKAYMTRLFDRDSFQASLTDVEREMRNGPL